MKPRTYIACFASAVAFAFAHAANQSNPSGRARATAEEAALAGVKKGHEAYLAAMRANDADAFARVVAPDVVFSPPQAMPVAGREAIRAWFKSGAEQMRTVAITVEDRNVIVAGDLAIEEGTFILTVVPAGGGAPVVDRGRFNATWKRQSGGEWQVLRNIWNSSLPAPAAADSDTVIAAARAAAEKHMAALNARDVETIRSQHAPDFSLIEAETTERLNMPFLQSAIGRERAKRWTESKTNWTIHDLQVQPYGNAAVVTFIQKGTARWTDGSVDARPRRVTEVWVNDGGTWKEAHHHDSVYAPNQPAAATGATGASRRTSQ